MENRDPLNAHMQAQIQAAWAMARETIAVDRMMVDWRQSAPPGLLKAKPAFSRELAKRFYRAGVNPANRLETLR